MKIKETKLGKVRETIVYGRLLRGSLIGLAIFGLAFTFLPVILAEANAANNLVKFGADWGQVNLELNPDTDAETNIGDAGHGDVDFGTITPSAQAGANYGTLRVLRKKISVTTNGQYFTVYLSTTNDKNGLLLSGNASSTVEVPAVGTDQNPASWATPRVFDGAEWGYAVPKTNIGINTDTPNTLPDFGFFSSATDSQLNTFESKLGKDIISTDNETAYTTAKWAPVPVKADAQQVFKASTNDDDGFGGEDGDSANYFIIYYGISVNTNVMAGTYSNTIVYTALASSTSLDKVSKNLAWDYRFGGKDDIETILFDLTESTDSTTITKDNIHVLLVPHKTIAALYNSQTGEYDLSSLDPGEYEQCTIGATANDGTSVVVEPTSGTIKCKIPSGTTYDYQLAADDDEIEDGEYDFWVHIDTYNYDYISRYSNGTEGAFKYVGLQTTMNSNGDRFVTTMQEMTPGVCKQTNMWNQLWGNAARIYDKDGYASEKAPLAATTEASAAEGLGSFSLTDARDGKKYVVRRLGDGNCWMVQNLDLELYAGMTLTSADTDLGNGTGSKDTWNVVDGSALSGNTNTTATNVGSLSTAWQGTHQGGDIKIYKGTWTAGTEGGEGESGTEAGWQETLVTECTDGTQETPCFVGAPSTANVAIGDVSNAATRYTFTLRKIDQATGTTNHTNHAVDSNGNGSTCSFVYTNSNYTEMIDGVATARPGLLVVDSDTGEGYCRVEVNKTLVGTTNIGTIITQYDGMSGYGAAIPTVKGVLLTGTGTFADITTPDNIDAAGAGGSIASSAGDYRWASNGSDGAHVYDQGPLLYSNNFTNASIKNAEGTGVSTAVNANTVPYQTPSATSAYGVQALEILGDTHITDGDTTTYTGQASYVGVASSSAVGSSNALCSAATYSSLGYSIGKVSGTLKDPNGTAYEFVTCLKDGKAAANTGFAGNWYNWYAATAGSGTSSMTNTDAKDSICPKGWRLPSNSGNGSFAYLLTGSTGYGLSSSSNKDTSLLSTPLAYIRSGKYLQEQNGSSFVGTYGWYWASKATGSVPAYRLSFRTEALSTNSYESRGTGFVVRCVAR